mmetsp:Transcript_3363/g.5897  ORF Transcript_3363/g.5897 Transcript_3363/m.5897 type:complete len:339 (-) Transcript_3363:523-1539(-)
MFMYISILNGAQLYLNDVSQKQIKNESCVSKNLYIKHSCSTRKRCAIVYTVNDDESIHENDDFEKELIKKVQVYFEQELESNQCPTEYDVLYTTLNKRGKIDLISLILEYGGHRKLVRKLNLPPIPDDLKVIEENVNIRRKENGNLISSYKDFVNKEEFIPRKPTDGFLSLGKSRDEIRLDPDIIQKEAIKAKETLIMKKSSKSDQNVVRKVSRTSRLIERLKNGPMYARMDSLVESEMVPEGEDMVLGLVERLAMIVFLGEIAVAMGPDTSNFIGSEIVLALKGFAAIAVIGHGALAVYATKLASEKNRNQVVWMFKVFLSGAVSLQKLQKMQKLEA